MREKVVKMKFTDIECNLLINGIFEWRNMLLKEGMPTEDVDALILKNIYKAEGKQKEKIMIDEWTGLEYELIGEQYYHTGRVTEIVLHEFIYIRYKNVQRRRSLLSAAVFLLGQGISF